MVAEAIRIGPFVGGLNTYSDETSIADTDLVELTNLELDIDGSLVSRPPIHDLGIEMPLGASGNMKLLGYYTTPSGVNYLIGSDGDTKTYYLSGSSWVEIPCGFAAVDMCQYFDRAYLLKGSGSGSGWWTPDDGFTAITNMVSGARVIAHKERIWICAGKGATNGSRVYFSELNGDVFNLSYIVVNDGDGQNVLDITTYFDSLLIFKNDSTYRYSYDLDPGLGVISRVSETVGIVDTGCYASYENRLFVTHQKNVYELTNYVYERLNDKVPLHTDSPTEAVSERVTLSYFADRLFVGFYDTMHVYSLLTRTWSHWKSDVLTNIGRMLPIPGAQDVSPVAYTYSTVPRANKLYEIVDAVSTNFEDMKCVFRTKNYDYQNAHAFKRLTWWGLDCIAWGDTVGETIPVRYSKQVTWDQLSEYSWDSLSQYTWGRLLESGTSSTDTVTIEGVTGERKFIKFMQAMPDQRFRQIAFRVTINTKGSIGNAPARVFNIMTFVKDKQKVSQKIN